MWSQTIASLSWCSCRITWNWRTFVEEKAIYPLPHTCSYNVLCFAFSSLIFFVKGALTMLMWDLGIAHCCEWLSECEFTESPRIHSCSTTILINCYWWWIIMNKDIFSSNILFFICKQSCLPGLGDRSVWLLSPFRLCRCCAAEISFSYGSSTSPEAYPPGWNWTTWAKSTV